MTQLGPTLFRSVKMDDSICLLRDDLPVPCMPRTSRRVRPRIRILQISESSTSLKFDRAMAAMLEEEIAESNWVGGSAGYNRRKLFGKITNLPLSVGVILGIFYLLACYIFCAKLHSICPFLP